MTRSNTFFDCGSWQEEWDRTLIRWGGFDKDKDGNRVIKNHCVLALIWVDTYTGPILEQRPRTSRGISYLG